MSSAHPPLVCWTDRGLYCPPGGFHIDPHRAVDVAVVTHAHSDHARRGSKRYLCATSGVGLMRSRLGQNIPVEGIAYGEPIRLGEVNVSLHPAGHILGSAQVRIEHRGEVWVASGDYKRDPDPSCEPFETVKCDTFITEATFGTPKYAWQKDRDHGADIHSWWSANASAGRNSILFGYSLGKAQRILAELAPHAHRPVLIHETIAELTDCYRAQGRKLAPTMELDSLEPHDPIEGELILAPPSILRTEWLRRFGRFETAFASGWMQNGSGGNWGAHGGSYDRGFVMSDHADWGDLNRTIDESGARRVFVLHRGNGALIRHLRKRGYDAHGVDGLELDNYLRLPQRNLSLFDGHPGLSGI